MKLISTYLLVLLLLTSVFRNAAGYVSFKIHQKFIATSLCVQKEIENNCCKGKCYLTEQISKNTKKQTSPADTPNSIKIPQLFYILPFTKPGSFFTGNSGNFTFKENLMLPVKNGFLLTVFHPPE